MNVTVDQRICREYANCVIESPEVFDLDDATGKALVQIPAPDAQLHSAVRAAAAACPVHAILIED
jgi:ferredoxin